MHLIFFSHPLGKGWDMPHREASPCGMCRVAVLPSNYFMAMATGAELAHLRWMESTIPAPQPPGPDHAGTDRSKNSSPLSSSKFISGCTLRPEHVPIAAPASPDKSGEHGTHVLKVLLSFLCLGTLSKRRFEILDPAPTAWVQLDCNQQTFRFHQLVVWSPFGNT